MLRYLLACALLFHAPPQDADKEAADLLKKLEDRLVGARTVHVEFDAAPPGPDKEKLKGEIKIGGNGTFLYKLVISKNAEPVGEMVIRSDGKKIVVNAPMPLDVSGWTPQSLEKMLRKSLVESSLMGMMLLFNSAAEIPPMRDIKSEGREKVGEVEASVVSFGMDIKERHGVTAHSFKVWIDPRTLTVLKRTMQVASREIIDEPCSRFVFDAPFAAEVFQFQLPANLAEGQAVQVARSIELYARFTGRLPKKLDDLKQRPADLPADIFWPDGGFWIGGAIPSLAYSADSQGFKVGSIQEMAPPFSPVGAPTDRLKKFYTARIQIQLIKAAAEGYLKASGTLPKSGEDLVKKPESAQTWPEGGWIGGGKIPVDPWGEAYVIRGGVSFLASVAKSKSRSIKSRDMTPEERHALEIVAMPALSDKDLQELKTLASALSAEKVEEREAATHAMLAKGGAALRWVVERMGEEKDAEALTRLGLIRDQLKQGGMTWESELKSLFAGLVGPGGGMMMGANERMGALGLKTIVTAQADFRANDRDGNRTNDFWVQDVAGLCGLKPGVGAAGMAAPAEEEKDMIRLIEPALAKADATETRWKYPVFGNKEPEPRGGYLFAALKNFEADGKVQPYHKGTGRHQDRFGFVAYPSGYGVSGRLTMVVNEDNTIWCQDLQGEEVDTYPANPAAEGWRKVD